MPPCLTLTSSLVRRAAVPPLQFSSCRRASLLLLRFTSDKGRNEKKKLKKRGKRREERNAYFQSNEGNKSPSNRKFGAFQVASICKC